MKELLSFSGLTTKVRAMQKYLISEDAFQRMRQLHSVSEAVEFLRQYPPYEMILRDIPASQMHRAVIEEQLIVTEYEDFQHLYRFAGVRQKEFMRMYFEHFEIALLKRSLRYAMAGEAQEGRFAGVYQFFERYSHLNLKKLEQADSLEHFVEATRGSQYFEILKLLYEQGNRRLIDYESASDMRYFRNMWEKNSKVMDKADRKIIERTLGAKIDILNLSWIYRAKKYYEMTETEIFALLIPIRYKLKREEIQAMVSAPDLASLRQLLLRSHYGRIPERVLEKNDAPKIWLQSLIEQTYRSSYQKNPYSIACLDTYFYLKEREIRRIITTIEEIRYGVNQTIYEKGGTVI